MELLNVEKLDVAIEKLLLCCKEKEFCIGSEEIDIEDAIGRYASEDIFAIFNMPPFRRSMVDGFALCSKDVQGASENMPTFLEVMGESKMGEKCEINIEDGECVYVPTGGALPEKADCVVMVEYIEHFSSDSIAVYKSIASGNNVIDIGDDYKKGDLLIKKGHKIRPSDIGLLSSNNIKKVSVYKKPIVSIISTGDELLDLGMSYIDGMIYDVNTYSLIGMSKKYGIDVFTHFLCRDEKEDIKNKLKLCMQKSDIVVLSGGSSKGKKDFAYEIINEICSAKVLTHGIAVKPGKPTITSYDEYTKTIVVGLPGHPVATVVLYKMLVVDLIYKLLGCKNINIKVKGIMQENIAQSPGRKTFQLVNIDENYNVSLVLGPSGLINTLSKADGYIVIEDDKEGVNIGEEVDVYLL